MNRQVLVIHNDLELCGSIQRALRAIGIEATCTMSEINTADILMNAECCMAIMGLLPSMDETLKIVRHIHRTKTVPILMIMKSAETSDKIRLFHAGVNACLEMPLDMGILAAQADSLIQLYWEAQAENRDEQPLVFHKELIMHPTYRQVVIDGERINLTRTEFDLLFCMAKHPGRVWSRKQLYNQVWTDTLGLEGESTVRTHIANLRKKLADAGKRYVQTARGIGYKFVPPSSK